jgi:hypothetical protein
MERDKGQGRPEGAPKEEDRAPKEQGRGHKESAERQSLPSVWDVLERRVRVQERYASLRESPERPVSNVIKKSHRDDLEVRLLEIELSEKGTARDKLICDLFYRTQPLLSPSREEFQKFRARTEALADEEIAEELRKHLETIRESSPQGPVFYSGVGLFDIYKRRDKKPS